MMAVQNREAGTSTTSWWSQVLAWFGKGLLIFIGLALCASLIFWDANFYVVRDRWEHFKLALLGDWHNTGWCPPGENIPGCAPKTPLEEALSQVDNLHFFKEKAISGTTYSVTTGANFASAQAVIKGQPSHQWCYIAYGENTVKNRLDLAEQTGTQTPVIADFISIRPEALNTLGLARKQLRQIAQTHCQFNAFTKPITEGED